MLTDRSRTSLALVSTLALGAALAAAPGSSRAQSFNGTPTVTSGSAAIGTGVGTTTVTVNSPQAVINWVPTDTAIGGGPIAFQNAATTATFQNGVSSGDYAVLNRIIPTDPTRAVKFDGTVRSILLSILSSGSGPATGGGTVFFYSPAGIIVGSNAVFDVGHLGLTTSDPYVDPVTGKFVNSNYVTFNGAASGSSVVIQPGATINAGKVGDSYFAAFAPVVSNAGSITGNGSSALVSADSGAIRFSPDGLFDISVFLGTGSTGTTLVNRGAIGGVAGVGAADSHRVYLVAVPRNDAITLAVTAGSTLGFDVAGAADKVGNAVILSAGYNINGGEVDVRSTPSNGILANIAIGEATFTSRTSAGALGDTALTATSGTASFASDVTLFGSESAEMIARPGGTILVNGSAAVSAAHFAQLPGDVGTGGTAQTLADGGLILIGGNFIVTAAGVGADGAYGDGPANSSGEFGSGGSGSIKLVNNGRLGVGGLTILDASGTGGSTTISDTAAGGGQGGIASLTVDGAGARANFAGGLIVSSRGTGGSAVDCAACIPESGAGVGGTASISGSGGAGSGFTVGTGLSVLADGIGGNGGVLPASAGTGGTAAIATGPGMAIIVNGPALIRATGTGGAEVGGTGGAGFGGNASIATLGAGGGILFNGVTNLAAEGQGGSAFRVNGTGGAATGGIAAISSNGAPIAFATTLTVSADARGGNGTNDLAGVGGSATGGSASISAIGGSVALSGKSSLTAQGIGGGSYSPGSGTGGLAAMTARRGTITGADFSVAADGRGGSGILGSVGGNGSGGVIRMAAQSDAAGGSSIGFTTASFRAAGYGGAGGRGVDGTSGTPEGPGGTGGTGTGGNVSALAGQGNGKLTTGSVQIVADGFGGAGGGGGSGFSAGGAPGGDGGTGIGGSVVAGSGGDSAALAPTGLADLGSATLSASGTGGNGGDSIVDVRRNTGGAGGAGLAGNATLLAAGGAVRIASAQLYANASGGTGGIGLTDGVGGAATLVAGSGFALDVRGPAAFPNRGQVTGGDLVLRSVALGGTGSAAGAASGTNGNSIRITGGDVRLASLDAMVGGGPTGAPTGADAIALNGGTLALTGPLGFTTTNTLSVTLDSSTVTASSTVLKAADFVFLAPRAASKGTLTSGTFALTTTNNAYLDASLAIGGPVTLNAPGAIDTGSISTPGAIALSAKTGSIRTDALRGGGVDAAALTSLTTGSIDAAQSVVLAAGGAIGTGAVTAGDRVDASASGNLLSGAISAGRVAPSASSAATYAVTLTSGGTLLTGDIAGNAVTAQSAGATTLGAVDARGNFNAIAGAGFTSQGMTAAGTLAVQAAQAIVTGALSGIQGVTMNAGTTLTAGPVTSAQKIALTAGGTATTGALSAGDRVIVGAGGNLSTGGVSAGRNAPSAASGATYAVALTSGGALQTGDILGNAVTAQAAGASSVGNVDARGAARLTSGTNLAAQTVNATGTLVATAGAALSLGNVNAADTRITAGTALNAGSVTSGQTVFLMAGTNLASGALSGRDVLALAAGSIATGAISATGTGTSGQVYLASSATIPAAALAAGIGPAAVLALAPVRSGGAISVGGPVSGRTLTAATQAGFTAPAIAAASSITVDAGGTAAVLGRWSAPLITISSNDLDIAATGRLDGGLGNIQLNSLNPAQALIGDGLSGTGYTLSNAEFARINSGNFTFVARDNAGAVDLAIGTLGVTGPDAGSTVDLPGGTVTFATGSVLAPSGGILVSGQLAATGFRDTNALVMATGRMQIDNAAGGLSVRGSGGVLAGQIVINAARFEAASAAILARLAADSGYAGHAAELNAPTGTVRAGGVISGGTLNFSAARAVLIQNTGSYADPAGFYTRLGALTAGSAAAPIELIVNGQLLAASGLVTGVKVHTAIRALGISGYTPRSMVNGCLVTLPLCGFPGYFPIPALRDEFQMVTLDQLSEEPFTNDGEERSERTGNGGLGPIAPPEPLIDTRPLDPPADIDDPVTGSGIPETGAHKDGGK